MKRKSTAIILVVALIISQWAIVFGGERLGEPQIRGEYSFSEMKYERPSLGELSALAEEIRTLTASAENGDMVIAKYDQLLEKYDALLGMSYLVQIEMYSDANNAYYMEEVRVTSSQLLKAYEMLRDTAGTILDSPCSEEVRSAWGEDYYRLVMAEEEITPQQIALAEKAVELINQYNNKSIENYYTHIDGRKVSVDDITQMYLNGEISYEKYREAYIEISEAQNNVLGNIYLDLVKINNEYARLMGDDNYLETAYGDFARSYTPKDAAKLQSNSMEIVYPLIQRVNRIIDTTELNTYSAENLSPQNTMEEVSKYIGDIGSDLKEAYDYMVKYGLYDLDYSPVKMNMGFTMMLPGFDSVYMFNQPYGDFYDFTTFVHELGHYNQAYFRTSKYSWPPKFNLDLLEVHSQGLELLFTDYYDEILGDLEEQGKAYILSNMLDSIVYACCIDELEQYAYTHEDISLKELNRKAKEIYTDYGYYSIDEEEYFGWVNVSHIFQTPGYFISYGVSAVSAMEIWAKSLDNREEAIEAYFILVDMANESYDEAISEAGLSQPFEKEVLAEIRGSVEKEMKIMIDCYNHWGEEKVDLMVKEGVVNGVKGSDGYYYFNPEKPVTRGEFVKMLCMLGEKLKGTPGKGEPREFTDVKENSWYSSYVDWAASNGIASGYNDGTFRPNDRIKRQDMAVMIENFIDSYSLDIEEGAETADFTDDDKISSYAKTAVHQLGRRGILSGRSDGSFAPQSELKRAEAVTVIYNILYED